MKKKYFMIQVLIIFSSTLHADGFGFLGPYEKKWRPLVENQLGQKVATFLWGKAVPVKKSGIYMPPIPKVSDQDSSSLDVYRLKNSLIYRQGMSYFEQDPEKLKSLRLLFIKELYEAVLQRLPSQEELEGAYNQLIQGGSYTGLYRSLVLSGEYREMEASSNNNASSVTEFVHVFGRDYLETPFKKQAVASFSFQSVKRMLVEKTLDILNIMGPQNPEHIHNWYALASVSIAKEYQALKLELERKDRTSLNPKAYHKWAKKVPFEVMKGELVIKLHKLINKKQETGF